MKVLKYLVVVLVMTGFITSCATTGVETNTDTISSECDLPPRLIESFPPRYPFEAVTKPTEGKVIVQGILTAEGVIRDIEVIESYPEGIFDKVAIEAVKQYRFIPEMKDCKPIDSLIKLPITFDVRRTTSYDYYKICKDGRRQFENKEYEEAIVTLTTAIYTSNRHSPAYYLRGLAYRAIGNNKKALSDFNRAIKLSREKAVYYFERGLVYLHMEDLKHALKDFNKAIEFDPDMTDAYFDRGEVFRLSTNYDDAISDYTKALSLDEGHLQAYINRGYCYQELNDSKNTCADYKKACELGDCSGYEGLKKIGTCSGDVSGQSEGIKK